MVKHQLKDKVQVINEDSMFYGRTGVVSRFNEDLFHNVFVWFEDNAQCNFRHKELMRVEQ